MPKADELIRAQRAEPQADKRKALIAQVWKMSQENVVYSPSTPKPISGAFAIACASRRGLTDLVRLRDIEPATN